MKYFVALFFVITSILFAQSEENNLQTGLPLVNDNITLLQNPVAEVQIIKLPRWNEIITNIPANIYGVSGNFFTSDNLPLLGFLAASTSALIVTDGITHSAIKNFFRVNKNFQAIENKSISLGDGKIDLGISGLFALYGGIFDDYISLRTGIQSSEAIISCGLTVQILKRITDRESPLTATSKSGTWRFFTNLKKYQKNQPKYYSFPSGHLSSAMTTLTVIAENYPNSTFIRPIGYSLLGILGIGLVSKDMHWFSDFPLAVALGYGFGKFITTANSSVHKVESPQSDLNFSFFPLFNTRSPGMNMLISF